LSVVGNILIKKKKSETQHFEIDAKLRENCVILIEYLNGETTVNHAQWLNIYKEK